MVIPNLMAEMGAKNGYIPPDETTFAWLKGRARGDYEPVYPDPDAEYTRVVEYDAEVIEPVVAKPHTVDNVAPLREVAGTRIDQIPASSEVYLAALNAGILRTFVEAGAVIESPGCGVSTANRNFRGRMGTKESEIYLASPLVVAASAVAGEIVHPRDL